MRILMIHGRSQGGKNPEELKDIWVDTLKKGFEVANLVIPNDVKIDFPFYGDKLDQFTQQSNLPTPDTVVQKGLGKNLEFEQFMQSMLAEIQKNAKITDSKVELEILDRKILKEKGIQNWEWVQAIARALDRHLTEASDFTIETFLKDVYLYVTKPAVTEGINKIVEEKLTDEPTIVIGHSLGSVVGYKIITSNLRKIKLVKYITVGSPLGLRAISSKLGVLENPAVNGWYNAYDERDIVALNPLNNDNFPTDPSILNNNSINNFTENRHGIIGYLNDAGVAKQIAQAFKF